MIALDGSASSDLDGTIASYSWSEGGLEIATGISPQVELSVGVHTITLTVTDDGGATDTDEVVITVESVNQSPTASAGLDEVLTDSDGSGAEQVTLSSAAD